MGCLQEEIHSLLLITLQSLAEGAKETCLPEDDFIDVGGYKIRSSRKRSKPVTERI